MKKYQLLINLVCGIMFIGQSQACSVRDVFFLTIYNKTSHTLRIHSKDQCSCASGPSVHGQDALIYPNTYATWDNQVDQNVSGGCVTKDTHVNYNIDVDDLGKDGIPIGQIAEYDFYEKSNKFQFWSSGIKAGFTGSSSNSKAGTQVDLVSDNTPQSDIFTITEKQ